MFEAIIFDFDGVMLDSEPIHYAACCSALKNIGLTLSYEEYTKKYIGLSDKAMFPKLLVNRGYHSEFLRTITMRQKQNVAVTIQR